MSVLRLIPRRHVDEIAPRRPIACRVRVRTQSGDTYCYHALVGHTCTAVKDALDYFGQCYVSVAACALPPVNANGGCHVQQ